MLKPRKPKDAALPAIPKELIDQFVQGPMTAEAVNAASLAFKKALIKRALGAELTHHLGYPAGAKPEAAGNLRNGVSGKTVLTDEGPLRIDVPRDREGCFEPILIPRHVRLRAELPPFGSVFGANQQDVANAFVGRRSMGSSGQVSIAESING
jgi:hypothetical protein